MNFTKTTSYSLSILSFMAKDEDTKVSADYLHEKLGIPYQYLRQILRNLSKNGFIRSTRGRNGGFEFRKAADRIFIADIIEVTEGLESFNRCILGFRECPFSSRCNLHDVWEETRNNSLRILRETSLADIVKAK
jgi:Rrf2 family protein